MEWVAVALLLRYWSEMPPAGELVAAYLGVKPKKTRPSSRKEIESFAAKLGLKMPQKKAT